MNHIYGFWDDVSAYDKSILGNKGYHLITMFQNEISVPPGFVIPTSTCKEYYHLGKKLSLEYKEMIKKKCRELEKVTGKELGNEENPLLVSIRSGAAVSMPGMLDTILNVGITQDMVFRTQEKYLLRAYITFLNEYVSGVYGIQLEEFEDDFSDKSVEQYKESILKKLDVFYQSTGEKLDDSIEHVIEKAVCSIFNSWYKPEAKSYRRNKNISDEIYTAVVIQEMKFGNRGERSGSGVLFTKNPITGADELYGEYIVNGQGVEVVNGVAETRPIEQMERDLNKVYAQLEYEVAKIKNLNAEPQDIEFTFEDGKLFILQTRNARINLKNKSE